MKNYISHRCEKSVARHASIRKLIQGRPYEQSMVGKWFIAKCELDSDLGEFYLHTLWIPIEYCPFCGEKLK